MAGELKVGYLPGKTIYFHLRDNTGQIWNGSAFEAYQTANIANYDIAATEQGSASGFYTATMPAASAGVYNVEAKLQAGASPAESDLSLGAGSIEWNGTTESYLFGDAKLAATGLNNISAADPAGVASTWAQMLVQVWRRMFKKSTLTSTELKTYDDTGTVVRTTQTVSEAAGTQTQGSAT